MSSRKWIAAALLTIMAVAGLALSGMFRAGAYPDERGDNSKSSTVKPKAALKETPFSRRAEERAIRKTCQDYTEAFNKGDLDALVGFWTEDAEYIPETGAVQQGRAAIRRLLKKALAEHKGSKQSVKVRSLRFIKPDVALEEGTVFMTSPEGNVEPGRYSAVWVKLGGKWQISCVRDLPEGTEEEQSTAYTKLKPLAWMVGEWEEKGSKGEVRMTCRWAPNQTFLIQEFSIKHADGTQLSARQRIGWDANSQGLRSWLFDSSGGFGGGFWTRHGNNWQIDCEGVFPDGKVSTSVHLWKYVDDNTVEWSATDREADELPLPDLNVTFVRKEKVR